MSLNDTLNEKVVPVVMKFVNTKGMQALKDGMLFTLPLNIVGSIFLLIAQFPVDAIKKPLEDAHIADMLSKVQSSSMGIMALVAVMGMAFIYARNEGVEAFSAAVMAAATFFILTNNFIDKKLMLVEEDGVQKLVDFDASKNLPALDYQVGGAISTDWLGGKGMITAIIVSLVVAWAYSAMIKADFKIKMPEGVPEGVVNGFSALLPAAVIFLGASLIYILLKVFMNISFTELIYKFVQTPLQAAADNPLGAFLIALFVPLLWFFGIHGGVTVGGAVGSLLTANTDANKQLKIQHGVLQLHYDNGDQAHIVTQQFYDSFINLAGSGQTLGLTIAMVLFAKSAQYKQLGKLAIVPNLFNINEPILFGTPIVLNPIMAVPFILTPVINAMLLYCAIRFQLIPPMGGALVPWTVPPVISGFILGADAGSAIGYAIMQLVCVIVGALVYFPFFKKQDAMAYADELAAEE